MTQSLDLERERQDYLTVKESETPVREQGQHWEGRTKTTCRRGSRKLYYGKKRLWTRLRSRRGTRGDTKVNALSGAIPSRTWDSPVGKQ